MTKAKLFSQRAGYTTPRTAIQIDSLDATTRTALWNCFYRYYLADFRNNQYFSEEYEFGRSYSKLWTDFFHQPIDELEHNSYGAHDHMHEYFFSRNWFEVFDFLEFVLLGYSYQHTNEQFSAAANAVLEQELSGYRIINNLFTPITSEEEIKAIEAALDAVDTLNSVRLHLQEALTKLSDRKNPDFRNSIKESISAVESLSRMISGKPKATLGDALSAIEKEGKIQIHKALKTGLSNIYGWTSDAQGIRHSLLDEPTLTFDDAKFMLVSCSAFINYLLAKCLAAGISIQS
jgi:hypothetical protein